jgi:hypothetical protein
MDPSTGPPDVDMDEVDWSLFGFDNQNLARNTEQQIRDFFNTDSDVPPALALNQNSSVHLAVFDTCELPPVP